MSRSLLIIALVTLVIVGLAPLVVMAARVSGADLAGIFDSRTLSLLGRSTLLGLGSSAIAVGLGAPFGYLTARTDVPGAALLRPLGLVPLLMPPLMLAMTWTVLIDLRGAPMTIMLLGLSTFPIVAIFTSRAAERIDARREDAARLVGGTMGVIRMELPLLIAPTLAGAALSFAFAVNDFSVPDYVSSVGAKFSVYADEIFATWQLDSNPGKAVATAVPLVALTLLALVPMLVLRRKGAMSTVDSGFQSPKPLALGRARIPALMFCLLAITLGALVPIGRLVFEAGGGTQGWTSEKLQAAFSRALELCRDSLGSTLVYSVLAAFACVPVALILGHAIQRMRRGWVLEFACVLPIAVPAILFGIGEIVLWSHASTNAIYGGGAMVVLMLMGRYIAFPVLVASGAVASLDPQLEEAARLAGAGPARRLGLIVGPALWPSMLASWALVFVLAMRELDAAILIPSANDMVMFRVFNAVHFGRDDFVAALALLAIFMILLPGILWSLFGRRRLELLP